MYKKSMEYLQIDDYAIDMHTSMGRKMGKNRKDFALEGSIVVKEDTEFLVKEWRDFYIKEKLDNPVRSKKNKKKAKKVEKVEEKKPEVKKVEEKKPEVKKTREQIRMEKYKRIKKIRGKPNFDDLEKDLVFIDAKTIDVNKIKLCSETTCGNKVMCFEYEGKIWKEGRKSMNYNRDYCVLDECKKLFGLKKIGMKRVLSNFNIEKSDKSKKSWKDNWKMVSWGTTGEDNKNVRIKVVYCVMDKITHCNWKVPMELSVIKHSFKNGECRRHLKEYVKIGVFRGIFRCSDFNCRNVIVGCDKTYLPDYFVSIDEGDIGKRLDIIGKREKWLIKALNKDKSIINEILEEMNKSWSEYDCLIWSIMADYNFSKELMDEVLKNFKNLRTDLENEGVEFD
jgi:hypothetical protein